MPGSEYTVSTLSVAVVVHGGYCVINLFFVLYRRVATLQVWHRPHPARSSRAVHMHVPRPQVFGEGKLAVVNQSRQQSHLVWWRPSSEKETWSPKCLRYFDANICPFLTLPGLSLEERSKVKKQQYGWHGSTNIPSISLLHQRVAKLLSKFLFACAPHRTVGLTTFYWWRALCLPIGQGLGTLGGKKKNLTQQTFCIGPMKCPNRQSLIMCHCKAVKPLVLRSRQLMINERLSVMSLWSQNCCKSSCKIHVVWSQLYSLLKWRWSWQQRSSSSSPGIQTSGDSCQVHKDKGQLQEGVKWK